MEMKDTFAMRLRSLRIMRGYSYRELSEAMGNVVSAQTLANYENPEDGVWFDTGQGQSGGHDKAH